MKRWLILLSLALAYGLASAASKKEEDEKPEPKGGFHKATPRSSSKAKPADEETIPKATPRASSKPKSTDDELPAKPRKPKPEEPEASATAEPKATPAATPGGTGAPPAFIESKDLKEFSAQPPRVQQLLESALALSQQGLTYKYGSDDPANGGMDCSGAVAYLLRAQGFKDVPRDSAGQYTWARKNGRFFAVISKKAGGFEFSDLQPGDLMFWSGTYAVDRDPPVTHSMIYLGEHKNRGQRVMWGSSDGRTYDGKARFGVGVFDFKMPKAAGEGDGTSAAGKNPDFLGYARIPGLREEATPPSEEPKAAPPKPESTPRKKRPKSTSS